MRGPEAVLLNGVYGVGKSTVLVEMADRLETAGVRYAALDLDWLAWAWSDDEGMDAADHPTASPLLLEHLGLVVGNLRRRGNDRYALAGSIASEAELERVRETMAMPLRVVLLTAPLAVVRARLGDEPTAGRAADTARTDAWAEGRHGPLTVPADLVVDADRSVGEVAADVLAALGWIQAER
jgi:shikimate kinase